MKLLDLFCGAGGCAAGYYRAGFTEIVGVDNRPMPRYPFAFVQLDAIGVLTTLLTREGRIHTKQGGVYRLDDFDAIHASPPCQRFSQATLVHGKKHTETHPDLVAPIRELLEATGKPWVMENVKGSPLSGYSVELCGMMFGLRVLRHRLFESSVLLLAPSHPKHPRGMLTNSHRAYDRGESRFVCVVGHNFAREEGEEAMGIDWMRSRKELAQAIPPAYTEFIGKQLIEAINRTEAPCKS